MKLKFKADLNDVLIFLAFAVFLLYIVCLGVLNFPELAINGRFYGLNPFPAFSSSKIGATLTFYFIFLGGIFFSVSSYFFERESGFGFGTDKSSKGYSHWAKEKEIKYDNGMLMVKPDDEESKGAGIPLIIKKDEVWVDNGEYHTIVIGSTGSGKTQTVIFPAVEILAKKKESMIITDPKGEIYETTSNMLRDRGYNVLVLNFRDPQQGNAWNPLHLPYTLYKNGNHDKSLELLDDLAANILYEEKSGNADPFWEKTSADYFTGLALGLFEDATEDKVNINSISLMTTVGEEKFGGSTYIKEYFGLKDPAGAAYTNASGTIMAPNETKGSIISVFKQKIKLFASREDLSEMLSHSDIDLATIGQRPTVLYIIIQDEKKTYHSLVTILLKQCYEVLIDVASKSGGKLPVRTNFLLDEFANMPPLKDITTMITAARSRLIRFTMIIQNFAQLDQVYGKENAETIRGNSGNIIYLITTELKALEEISKMCGEVKSKKDDKTASTPLVTISDLQRMKQWEVIIMRIRKNPFKTKFIPYYQMDFGKKYPKAEYPHREKEPVNIFDLREHVKEAKKAKLMEMMNDPAAGSSGGMGLPPGMFPPGMMPPGMEGRMPPGMPPGMMPPGMEGRMPPGMPPGMMPPGMMGGMPSPNAGTGAPNPGINVDDIVKRIDAKIAEIEAEEKRQKEMADKAAAPKEEVAPKLDPPTPKEEVVPKPEPPTPRPEVVEAKVEPVTKEDDFVPPPIAEAILREKEEQGKSIQDLLSKIDQNVKKQDETPTPVNKPIINEEKIPEKEIAITDDQFFDDFFDD